LFVILLQPPRAALFLRKLMQDLLARWFARRQIDQAKYEAGRKWQAAYRARDKAVLKIADAALKRVDLRRKVTDPEIDHFALLINVLSQPEANDWEDGSRLAQAVKSRGDSTTGSRDMRDAAYDIQFMLGLLVDAFAPGDETETPKVKPWPREVEEREHALAGVSISGPGTDAGLGRVQSLARAKGFRVVDNGRGAFNVVTANNKPTNLRGVDLASAHAALANTPKYEPQVAPRKRRPGARDRSLITLAQRTPKVW
jgi:hypothetical protein